MQTVTSERMLSITGKTSSSHDGWSSHLECEARAWMVKKKPGNQAVPLLFGSTMS
jgi:hypothetical protein